MNFFNNTIIYFKPLIELENDETIYQKIQINAKLLIDQKFNTLEFGKNLFNIVGK